MRHKRTYIRVNEGGGRPRREHAFESCRLFFSLRVNTPRVTKISQCTTLFLVYEEKHKSFSKFGQTGHWARRLSGRFWRQDALQGPTRFKARRFSRQDAFVDCKLFKTRACEGLTLFQGRTLFKTRRFFEQDALQDRMLFKTGRFPRHDACQGTTLVKPGRFSSRTSRLVAFQSRTQVGPLRVAGQDAFHPTTMVGAGLLPQLSKLPSRREQRACLKSVALWKASWETKTVGMGHFADSVVSAISLLSGEDSFESVAYTWCVLLGAAALVLLAAKKRGDDIYPVWLGAVPGIS